MLMREAAGFSSGQRFHHSYRLRFPTDSTATRTLSVSLFLHPPTPFVQRSQDPISRTIISFRKPSIRKGWICTGPRSGLLIDCWPNVVSTLAAITVNLWNESSAVPVSRDARTITALINLIIKWKKILLFREDVFYLTNNVIYLENISESNSPIIKYSWEIFQYLTLFCQKIKNIKIIRSIVKLLINY